MRIVHSDRIIVHFLEDCTHRSVSDLCSGLLNQCSLDCYPQCTVSVYVGRGIMVMLGIASPVGTIEEYGFGVNCRLRGMRRSRMSLWILWE